jgi:two-component system sensor histidine kinase RegB
MNLSDIAALTIHDVKNQLARLAGLAEQRGDRETVHVAIEAAAKLTALLILDKAETGALRPNIEALAPVDLLDELVRESRGMLDGIVIEQDCQDAPTLAFYDGPLVRMALANALNNASRYARSCIRISATEDDGYCVFTVSDDGGGYAQEVLADHGASAGVSAAGTGLGLRLAGRIAEQHENRGRRGSLSLANDGGAVFVLRLPM